MFCRLLHRCRRNHHLQQQQRLLVCAGGLKRDFALPWSVTTSHSKCVINEISVVKIVQLRWYISVEEYWLEKTISVENPVSLPLCLPHIPHELVWDRTCTAAAAFLKKVTKLVMFSSQGLSKRAWTIRCGRRDQLDDVNCGHGEDDDDDSDTWFSSTGGPIWPLSINPYPTNVENSVSS